MIGKATPSKEPDYIEGVNEYLLTRHYLNIDRIPIKISNPLREDKHPSLSLYSLDGKRIWYKDHGTGDSGTIWKLLTEGFHLNMQDLVKQYMDKGGVGVINTSTHQKSKMDNIISTSNIDFKIRKRDWEKHDLDYWNTYGISKEWLEFADIYPISHKIIVKDGINYLYKADKYAYAYVEFKDDRTFIKIYQPFNINGFKWSGKHNKSILSLWRKIPQNGKILCICASMKDALCLWANTSIPSVAPQGEGYPLKPVVIEDLKKRYSKVFILFDNDETGVIDTYKLAESTGFQPLFLPNIDGKKDISDLYAHMNDRNRFKELILTLFKLNYYGK